MATIGLDKLFYADGDLIGKRVENLKIIWYNMVY